MKKTGLKRIFSILAVSILIAQFTGCALLPQEEETLAPPLVQPEEVSYKTETVKIGNIEDNVDVMGFIVPAKSENLVFRYNNGRIKKIYAAVGEQVKKGDIIAELLTDGLESDLAMQKVLVESKKSILDDTKKMMELDLENQSEKEKQLENKYADMNAESGKYSREDLDTASQNLNEQKAAVQRLVLNNKIQIENLETELKLAEMKLDDINNDISSSQLVSTLDGQVTYITSVKEGDYIDAFATVATVADSSILQVEYSGNQAQKFKIGNKVQILIGNESYEGEVVLTPSSVPLEEKERYTDTIRVSVSNISNVKAGDSAKIKLTLASAQNTVIIPKSAVHAYLNNKIVYVLENGVRAERYVETGIESSDTIQITDGLKEGELVITD